MSISSKHPKEKGFTLVELIVSIGLFAIIMLISLTVLFTLVSANSKARSTQVAADNVGFVMEDMIRSLRFGYDYHCDVNTGTVSEPLDCENGASSIAFTDGFEDVQAGYRLGTEDGRDVVQKFDNGDYVSITPENVDVQNFRVYVVGSNHDDTQHARVRLVLQVVVTDGQQNTDITLQATVAQRFND